MSNKIIILKSKSLLRLCQNVFGNVIINAYITTYYYPNLETEKDVIERLGDSELEFFSQNVSSQEFDYSGEEIVLEFSNGQKILFSNSEWAYMSNLNQVDYTESKVEIKYE